MVGRWLHGEKSRLKSLLFNYSDNEVNGIILDVSLIA